MLRALLWLGQFAIVAPSVYETVVSLAGLRTPTPVRPSGTSVRIRAVVAAHDEEAVIGGITSDLASQVIEPGRLDAWVVADRCSDATAEVAGRHVAVVERIDGVGGKGAAIAWFLAEHPLADDEALLVLDADNRIEPTFVSDVAAAIDPDGGAVQAYLDVANPDASALALANALTYWASNRSVQLARSNLGWSADLGGTGMAIPARALADAGGFTDDLTDDLALNIRLNLVDHRTRWLHDVRVRDEKPERTDDAITQRARWVRGKREVRRQYAGTLIRTAIREHRPDLADLAMRLLNPGRSFLALGLVGLTAASVAVPAAGLWSPWLLGSISVVVISLPVAFLVIDGVPGRYIARYPYVAAIGILWLPIRVTSRLISGWRRTPHVG
jgi:cellulose synthase/poly-beta-1,6-N-acetylglucosamine synthase-like glycosyltransferase